MPPLGSMACGVGHPIEPVPDVRGTDARRRKRDRPDGVIHGFHVILYKVDPSIRVVARNLLSKNNCRSALADEVVPGWPQVPLVSKCQSFACLGERLAGTGAGPDGPVVGPACAAQCQRPDADSGEEVVLAISPEVLGSHILNISFIYIARRYVAGGDQVAQPCGCIWIDLVVIGAHIPATHKGHSGGLSQVGQQVVLAATTRGSAPLETMCTTAFESSAARAATLRCARAHPTLQLSVSMVVVVFMFLALRRPIAPAVRRRAAVKSAERTSATRDRVSEKWYCWDVPLDGGTNQA